jgi:hypothetical protein
MTFHFSQKGPLADRMAELSPDVAAALLGSLQTDDEEKADKAKRLREALTMATSYVRKLKQNQRDDEVKTAFFLSCWSFLFL